MVVKTQWPGASAREVEQQVTDRIERKLQEVPERRLGAQLFASRASRWCSSRSATRRRAAEVPETWYQVRKKIGDIRNTLPSGIQGPFFNDEFGDTYANIYALTGDGFGYRDLKDFGDRIRAELLRVPGRRQGRLHRRAGGEDLRRDRPTPSSRRSASSPPRSSRRSPRRTPWRRRASSRRRPTASTCAPPARSTRSTRSATSRSAPTTACSASATSPTVTRGYVDPPQQRMRFQGREALGIGVTMAAGGDVIELGQRRSTPRSRGCGRSCRSASRSSRSRACRTRCSARSTSSCARSPRRC